ncbi:hypothetical protein AALC75_12355 [Lachnospiraceae bacterium 48-42]
MSVLTCDVCGGSLSIDAGGKTATCDCCGMKHSMERMREKVQEIKGTVSIQGTVKTRQTGSEEDVWQWKQLLYKYMNAHDYSAAISIVKKILEAAPNDSEANHAYDSLRDLQYFDIRNGVLLKYNGKSKIISVPNGVVKINEYAFDADIEKLILPETYTKIDSCICGGRIHELILPKTFAEINTHICEEYIGKLILPETQIVINHSICRSIGELILSETQPVFNCSICEWGIDKLILPGRQLKIPVCICGDRIGELKISKEFPIVDTYICGGGIGKMVLADLCSKITLPICKRRINDAIVFQKNVILKEAFECHKAIVKENTDYFLPYLRCSYLKLPSNFNGDVDLINKNYLLKDIECSKEYKEKVIDYILLQFRKGIKTDGKSILDSPFAKAIEEKCRQGVCWYCGGRSFTKRWFGVVCDNCGKERIFNPVIIHSYNF